MRATGNRRQQKLEDRLMSERMLAGKCFCGAVEYAVADAFVYAANCHCSNCRRTTGSAFKPFAGIERGELRLTKGEGDLMIYGRRRTTTRIAGDAARCSIRWCATAPMSMSRWARWSTIPPSARRSTSLSARRPLGSLSLTTWRNSKDTPPQAHDRLPRRPGRSYDPPCLRAALPTIMAAAKKLAAVF